MSDIKTPDDFGGTERCIQICTPAGIGDISWVYSKLWCLKTLFPKYETIFYLPGGGADIKRGEDFVRMLPGVHWGGYLEDKESFEVVSQCWPSDWMSNQGAGFMLKPYIQNVSANIHMETGGKLADWLPKLPINYHYPLAFSSEDIERGRQLMERHPRPIVAVYVSNRAKESQVHGGWNLWSVNQWFSVLQHIHREVCGKYGECVFAVIGASYDADKSNEIISLLDAYGLPVFPVLGEPLGAALHVLRYSDYALCYPSGIGILADVMSVPGVMLLPWLLESLETAYADPATMATNQYRAWSDPSPSEFCDYFSRIGIHQALIGDRLPLDYTYKG